MRWMNPRCSQTKASGLFHHCTRTFQVWWTLKRPGQSCKQTLSVWSFFPYCTWVLFSGETHQEYVAAINQAGTVIINSIYVLYNLCVLLLGRELTCFIGSGQSRAETSLRPELLTLTKNTLQCGLLTPLRRELRAFTSSSHDCSVFVPKYL